MTLSYFLAIRYYHDISFYFIIYRYISSYIVISHYISLYIMISHDISWYLIISHYILIYKKLPGFSSPVTFHWLIPGTYIFCRLLDQALGGPSTRTRAGRTRLRWLETKSSNKFLGIPGFCDGADGKAGWISTHDGSMVLLYMVTRIPSI